jgi:hypothetical protein
VGQPGVAACRGAGCNQWQLESREDIRVNEILESMMGEKRGARGWALEQGVGRLYIYPVTSL